MCLRVSKGPLKIRYLSSSSLGLKSARLLARVGVFAEPPAKMTDVNFVDSPYGKQWEILFLVSQACRKQWGLIQRKVKKIFPMVDRYRQEALTSNVTKAWTLWLAKLMYLRKAAEIHVVEEGVPKEMIVILSPYASLVEMVDVAGCPGLDVPLYEQQAFNKSTMYIWGALFLSLKRLFQETLFCLLGGEMKRRESPGCIATGAAWDIKGMTAMMLDDLFWWRNSSVPPERVVYLYDRADIQPTRERYQVTSELGISSRAMNAEYLGDHPEIMMQPRGQWPLSAYFRNVCFAIKMLLRSLCTEKISQSIYSILSAQEIMSFEAAQYLKELNVKAVFHHQEVGIDFLSLAANRIDAIRLGIHWSSVNGVCDLSPAHEVFFIWGDHDAQIYLDSQAASPNLLLSGCFINDHSNLEAREKASSAAIEMKKNGVKCILALFDTSTPTPEFYKFFLNWVKEDSSIGLLIKSKGGRIFTRAKAQNLDDLLQEAQVTGRVHMIDGTASPGDAAHSADFSIGLGSYSAVVTAALKGARIIYLDYERLEQGPLQAYTTLHSLGPGRCIFGDHASLKAAIEAFMEEPEAHPELGDASPVIERFDPYRDGMASQRVGSYLQWYLEARDEGMNKEAAIKEANVKYADRWGQSRVVRGL